jgi:hypothetical protein
MYNPEAATDREHEQGFRHYARVLGTIRGQVAFEGFLKRAYAAHHGGFADFQSLRDVFASALMEQAGSPRYQGSTLQCACYLSDMPESVLVRFDLAVIAFRPIGVRA